VSTSLIVKGQTGIDTIDTVTRGSTEREVERVKVFMMFFVFKSNFITSVSTMSLEIGSGGMESVRIRGIHVVPSTFEFFEWNRNLVIYVWFVTF